MFSSGARWWRFLWTSDVSAAPTQDASISDQTLIQGMKPNQSPIRLETGASSFCLLHSSRQHGYATESEQSWQEAAVWNQTEDADHLRGTCSRSRLCFPLRSQLAKTRNFPVTVRWFSKRHLFDFREEHSKRKPSSFSSWKWCVLAASWLLPQLRPVRKNLMVFMNRKATNGPVEPDSSSAYRVQNTPRGTTPRCYFRGGMLRNISNGFNWKKKVGRFRPGSSRIQKLKVHNKKFDRNGWGWKTLQQRG